MAYKQARLQALAKAAGPNPLKLVASAAPDDKHDNDVVTLCLHNDQIISGADDGKVKIWSMDLKLEHQFQAHPVNVYSLAVLDDTLYTCSNDGTLKAWNTGSWDLKSILMEKQAAEVIKVYVDDGKLYAGNSNGEIFVFENEQMTATYCLHEDILDFIVIGNLVFNARSADVSVTEMMGGPRFNYMSRGAMLGRFPVRRIGDKIVFLSRCAKQIYVHECSKEEKFKRLLEIKAHEMTISAMCQLPGKDHVLLSGGYDRVIKAWDINTKKKLGQLDVGVCVNELVPGPSGRIYIGGSEGYIVCLEYTL